MSMELTDRILPEDEKAVFEGLLAFNLAHLEDKEPRDLGIYERDGENKIVAGIIGYTHGNWLMIKYLWVKEDLRGQGTGKKLLWEAEKEAEKRNCKYVFLDTFSFQAPEFPNLQISFLHDLYYLCLPQYGKVCVLNNVCKFDR